MLRPRVVWSGLVNDGNTCRVVSGFNGVGAPTYIVEEASRDTMGATRWNTLGTEYPLAQLALAHALRLVGTNDALDLLEELLSVTEALRKKMDHEQADTWSRIAASCADLRDGSDV